MSKNSLCCPVNLTVNCDWGKIKDIYARLILLKNNNKLTKTPLEHHDMYSIDKLGSIISSRNVTDYEWNHWCGELLSSHVPDNIKFLVSTMISEGIKFVDYTYTIHDGGIKEHIDTGNPESGHCNINYIVYSDDPSATTYVKSRDSTVIENYISQSNTAWLIDTASPHYLINTGHREVFQIKFFSSYTIVKDFLIRHGLVIA